MYKNLSVLFAVICILAFQICEFEACNSAGSDSEAKTKGSNKSSKAAKTSNAVASKPAPAVSETHRPPTTTAAAAPGPRTPQRQAGIAPPKARTRQTRTRHTGGYARAGVPAHMPAGVVAGGGIF